MKKSLLIQKILCSIFTISVFSGASIVSANSGGFVDSDGDYVGNYSPSGSNIYIDNGYDGNVYGGKVDSGAVENNKIYITGVTVTGNIYVGK